MDNESLKQTVATFLNNHRKAVVSVVGNDNHPSTSLMLYAIDENFNFYFGTRKAFGKYEAIKGNPNAALTVVQESIDPLQAVSVRGVVEFVSEDKTKEILEFFESKNPSEFYVKGADDFIMFMVKPNFIRYLDATSGELVMEEVEL